MAKVGRKGIIYENVAKACQQLQKDGEKVSVRNVMAFTGGSFSTVSGHIKDWQEKSSIDRVVSLPNDLIISLKTSFNNMLSEERTLNKAALLREIDRTREALKQTIELESQRDGLGKKIEDITYDFNAHTRKFEKQLAAAESRVDDSIQREKLLQKHLDESREALHKSEIALAVAQTRIEAFIKKEDLEKTRDQDRKSTKSKNIT